MSNRIEEQLNEGLGHFGKGDNAAAMACWEAVLAAEPQNVRAREFISYVRTTRPPGPASTAPAEESAAPASALSTLPPWVGGPLSFSSPVTRTTPLTEAEEALLNLRPPLGHGSPTVGRLPVVPPKRLDRASSPAAAGDWFQDAVVNPAGAAPLEELPVDPVKQDTGLPPRPRTALEDLARALPAVPPPAVTPPHDMGVDLDLPGLGSPFFTPGEDVMARGAALFGEEPALAPPAQPLESDSLRVEPFPIHDPGTAEAPETAVEVDAVVEEESLASPEFPAAAEAEAESETAVDAEAVLESASADAPPEDSETVVESDSVVESETVVEDPAAAPASPSSGPWETELTLSVESDLSGVEVAAPSLAAGGDIDVTVVEEDANADGLHALWGGGPERAPTEPAVASPWDDGASPNSGVVDLDHVQPRASTPRSGGTASPRSAPKEAPSGPADVKQACAAKMARVKELHDLGDFSGSLEIVEKVLELDPGNPEARDYMERNEETLLKMYQSKLGELDKTPGMQMSPDQVIWLNLHHRAGFVLSRVDGMSTFEDIVTLSAMPRLDTVRILAQLLQSGVIAVK